MIFAVKSSFAPTRGRGLKPDIGAGGRSSGGFGNVQIINQTGARIEARPERGANGTQLRVLVRQEIKNTIGGGFANPELDQMRGPRRVLINR